MVTEAGRMSTVKIDLEEGLAALLHQTNQTVQDAAREMIVLELYRRGSISSGKAAELKPVMRISAEPEDLLVHSSDPFLRLGPRRDRLRTVPGSRNALLDKRCRSHHA